MAVNELIQESTPVVLIVDDNPSNVKVLGYMLMKQGYKIVIANNSTDALKYVLVTEPDIILLDIVMPQINGFELCQLLKNKNETRDIPIVFITALSSTEDKLKGFKLGGEDFITKPFIQEEVIARINLVIERRRIKQALQKAQEELEMKVEERTQELKKIQSQLVMKEKLASIGQLAAGIAHELNNPINYVYTNFYTLKDNVKDFVHLLAKYRDVIERFRHEADCREELKEIMVYENDNHLDFILNDTSKIFSDTDEGFRRIKSIIKSMLNFSRADDWDDFVLFDVNKGITDTLIFAKNEYKYCADVQVECQPLPLILCNPLQLNQVFLNLIINSAQAIAEQGRAEKGLIKIKTGHNENSITCEVFDNGPGIPKENLCRIFEPFFTTKQPGKGTGLGLSISYDIVVNKHNGSLTVQSNVSSGTTFTIRLPVRQNDE